MFAYLNYLFIEMLFQTAERLRHSGCIRAN